MHIVSEEYPAEPKLSAILAGMPRDEVIAGVHQAVRYLSHVNAAASGDFLEYPQEYFFEFGGSNRQSAETAKSLITAIEEVQGQTVAEMPKKVADDYIWLLTELMFAATSKDFPLNPVRGRELLDQLRAGYGAVLGMSK